MEHDYSHFFDASCNRYDHYLDTILDKLEIIKVGEDASSHPTVDIPGGYNALENDLFVPKSYHTNKRDGIPVIFDSGCTHVGAPVESDFVGEITPINKMMNGLGATVKVVGVGTVG